MISRLNVEFKKKSNLNFINIIQIILKLFFSFIKKLGETNLQLEKKIEKKITSNKLYYEQVFF